MKLNDKIIFHKLDTLLNVVYKKYGKEQVLGIFMLQEMGDYLKTVAVIIPPFDKICSSIREIKTKINYGEDIILVHDVRSIYNATKRGYKFMIQGVKTDYRIVNPLYKHIFDKLVLDNKFKIMAGITSGQPAPELGVALTKICRLCWNETSNAVKFIKKLTDTEKTALEHMVSVIGDEGYFFQAKEASACGVSRITYTNLMAKMMDYGVAEVHFLGPKGTYVKIIDDTLLDIRGNGYLT